LNLSCQARIQRPKKFLSRDDFHAIVMELARAEVGFVQLNLAAHRRVLLAKPRHARAQGSHMAVDGNAAQTGQIGDLSGV